MKSVSMHHLRCSSCNVELPAESQFCPSCGQGTPAPSPTQSMPKHAMQSSAMNTLGAQPTYFPSEMNPATTRELEPGERFADRYEIERPLGRGGMGTVYLAKDEVSQKPVAIKILNAGRLSDGDVRRLIDEGMLARDIRHRNVVAVYDADIFDGQPFMTMEYVAGMSLRELLRQRQTDQECFSLSEAAAIIAQILDGLQAAHQAQVVHRDLKPENIMVLADDQNGFNVKILDFGIAKNETQSRDSGSTAGTLGYMSPEQFTSADLVGPSSDLYSVSVIFYELLVGALPRGHWQPPSKGREDVPKEIDELIEKGLSNRALNRPQSAREYQLNMEEILDNVSPSTWQKSVAGIGQSFQNHMKQSWSLGSKSEWWSSLTFQTKAWIIAGIIIVCGILGAAMDEMGLDSSDYSNTNSSSEVDSPDSSYSVQRFNPKLEDQDQSYSGFGQTPAW